MTTNYQGWRNWFLFCAGLFAGTAFCMKWMEGDLQVNGEVFTILGLEISYPREKMMALLSGMDEKVSSILRYHLYFDFAFMAGVYPGIAALCMMAREKCRRPWLRKTLLIFACLQLLAWGCDIAENLYLLKWIRQPVIGNELAVYHGIVALKWLLALTALILAIPLAWKKRRTGA